MNDTIKEEIINFSNITINEPETAIDMRQVLEQEINKLTLEEGNMFKNLLKEKKSLHEISDDGVILLLILSVVLLISLSVSTISVLFDSNILKMVLSLFSSLSIIFYFLISFSKKTFFGRFFCNINIRLNKQKELNKIYDNLPVSKNILSSFKKAYGQKKLKNLMMYHDIITYGDVKSIVEKIEAENEFKKKIKQRDEKEKKIDEIVSSL